MDSEDGVRLMDGVIYIDHPDIEAGLHALAARWNVSVEDALGISLRRALAEHGIAFDALPELPG